MAVSNDERHFYTFPVEHAGEDRIARLPADGGPVANLSNLSTETRLVVLRGGGPRPPGTVVFVGRQLGQAGSATLFLASSALDVQASVQLPESPGAKAWDLIVAPDERTAYVNTPQRIYAIDLATASINRTAVSQRGLLSTSANGNQVYVTDPGGFDSFASGIVIEYSADLETRRDISLLSPGSIEPPPHARQVAVTRDGRTGFVLTGTTELSAAGLERGSVMVLDLATGAVTKRIELEEYVRFPTMFLLEPTPP